MKNKTNDNGFGFVRNNNFIIFAEINNLFSTNKNEKKFIIYGICIHFDRMFFSGYHFSKKRCKT